MLSKHFYYRYTLEYSCLKIKKYDFNLSALSILLDPDPEQLILDPQHCIVQKFIAVTVIFLNLQAMLKAAQMASRNFVGGDTPPPYTPPTSGWYMAPPPAYSANPAGYQVPIPSLYSVHEWLVHGTPSCTLR